MRRIFASVAILVASTAYPIDLEQAYQDALQNDPVLAGAVANNKLSHQNYWQGLSALLPIVSGSISRGQSDFERKQGLSGFPFEIAEGTSENQSWGVNLNQLVFDSNVLFGIGALNKQRKGADWDLRAAQHQLITRVAEAYLNVLQAQDNLESTIAAEEAVQRQLEQVQQRYDVGLVAITDVLDATASYDLAVVERLTSRSTHGLFFESLQTLTGVRYDEVAKLKDELPIEPPQPNDEESWVQVAMVQSPQINSTRYNWEAAKSNHNTSFSYLLPRVSASATKRYSEDPLSVFLNESTTTSYSVSASIPFFSGGRNILNVRTTALQADRAKQTHIQAQLTVARDTRNLFRLVQNDVERVSARFKSIQSSEASLKATQTGYEVGTRNIVEVLQKQQQLYQSIFAYAAARYTYILNGLRLKQTVGTLSEGDIDGLNRFIDPASVVKRITTASGKPST